MFLKITATDDSFVLIPTNYVTNITVSTARLITGVEYLDAAAAAAPVTVVVTGVTATSNPRYELGDFCNGPIFLPVLSSRNL